MVAVLQSTGCRRAVGVPRGSDLLGAKRIVRRTSESEEAKSGAETIASWVIGEAMKMGATIAMFVAIAYGFKGVLWVPLLVTYLIALKTYWIAMAWK